ncbi:MAG: hypothetical protein LBM09_01095, partial [Candidatus Nomurabacteria bacterium]|nr:hypothetical protein [Candidatus Nomurabacteria bacterium]
MKRSVVGTLAKCGRFGALLLLTVALVVSSSQITLAMSDAQRRLFDLGIPYYDVGEGAGGSNGSSNIGACYTPTNTGDIPYQLPALEGGYGHEAPIQEDGTIPGGGKVTFG